MGLKWRVKLADAFHLAESQYTTLYSVQKLEAVKTIYLQYLRQLLDCHYIYIYISLESSFGAECEYVKIFQQHFALVVKSQEDEKYTFLSQGACVLLIFTVEGFIFTNCECITISTSLSLKTEIQVKKRDLFDCFGRKH